MEQNIVIGNRNSLHFINSCYEKIEKADINNQSKWTTLENGIVGTMCGHYGSIHKALLTMSMKNDERDKYQDNIWSYFKALSQ